MDSTGLSPTASGRIDRPTLTDVARLAGVSRQTASRVARGGLLVNAETARRVQQVIDDLGYRPNVVARALSVGVTHQIGVVTHSTAGFGQGALLRGVEKAVDEIGYRVVISRIRSLAAAEVQEAVDDLVRLGCDGLVLQAPWLTAGEALSQLSSPVPLVTTSEVLGYSGPAVSVDGVAAADLATTHLLGLGHATVHHVAGPDGWSASRLRTEGWRRALRREGRDEPDVMVGDWTSRSGARWGAELAADPSVTAIFVANDTMALGLLYALAEAGRSVPGEVSVVGFDGQPEGEHFQPPLTTMSADADEHGRLAVQMVRSMLGLADTPPNPTVWTALVERASTAPPPA